MLRFYTPGRADEVAIDEVLAVEELVFPFAGAEVLPLREVHVCRVGIGLCNHPRHLATGGTFGSERDRRQSVSPVQSTDLVPPTSSPWRLKKRAFGETLSRGPPSSPDAPGSVLFCCLTKLCLLPPSRAVKKKTPPNPFYSTIKRLIGP